MTMKDLFFFTSYFVIDTSLYLSVVNIKKAKIRTYFIWNFLIYIDQLSFEAYKYFYF